MSENPSAAIDDAVTTVIVQRPHRNHVGAYENWLKEIVPVAQGFTGHRGVNIIRPHGHATDYTIILHFDSEAHLRGWLESDVRRALIEKVRPFLATEEEIDITTGLEFWFTPQDAKKNVPAYKQFLITLSAIFPLTIIVPWLMNPFFSAMPVLAGPVVRPFIVAGIIVALMTFVIMPRYVRFVSAWLYR